MRGGFKCKAPRAPFGHACDTDPSIMFPRDVEAHLVSPPPGERRLAWEWWLSFLVKLHQTEPNHHSHASPCFIIARCILNCRPYRLPAERACWPCRCSSWQLLLSTVAGSIPQFLSHGRSALPRLIFKCLIFSGSFLFPRFSSRKTKIVCGLPMNFHHCFS